MSAVAVKRNYSPLLAAYLEQLIKRPLLTKMCTAGTLSFLQEILASHLAGAPPARLPKSSPAIAHILARSHIDLRAFKLALYGFLISAPMGHVLVGTLQKYFAGKTGTAAKIGQILASNLIVAPIQTAVYLASMAVVNGAKSTGEIKRAVKGGYMKVLQMTWFTSPIALVVAQRFIAPELWVPFLNLVQFVMGTYVNTTMKKAKLRAENAKKDQD
ncbi:hypothetical protein BOTBODRAFT_167581 [Botryobasidium botryosum FD-172 SS1]|uniref:Uncharacterized protein n=1 Tax=Botryobasidium botryosum (strain FD-172 SS1) TaxID=930990 RepID=A0A067M5T3_BOTB1|nr:hypothetical protein BOTBODRAFT_167581 [Botryobasidium botryosum FD-172 SS1]